jgi:hypothetical protein
METKVNVIVVPKGDEEDTTSQNKNKWSISDFKKREDDFRKQGNTIFADIIHFQLHCVEQKCSTLE